MLNENLNSGNTSLVADIVDSALYKGISAKATSDAAKIDDIKNIKKVFNMFLSLKFPLYIKQPIKNTLENIQIMYAIKQFANSIIAKLNMYSKGF